MNGEIKNSITVISDLLNKADAVRINNITGSISLAKKAIALSRSFSNKQLYAKGLTQLSFYYMIVGKNSKSLQLATEAGQIFESLDDEKGLAESKYTIGSVYYKSDNLHLGLKYLSECIGIFRKYNDFLMMAKTYKSLGTIYEYFGDTDNAKEVYRLAIDAARECGDLNMKTNVYNPLSGIYLNENEPGLAMDLIMESIAIKEKTGDLRGIAFAYYGLGKIYTKTKKYTEAEKYYTKSITIHLEMGEKLGLGYSYNKLGVLYLEQNRFEEAVQTAEKSLKLIRTFKSRMIKTGAIMLLYKVYDKQKNTENALKYLRIYLKEQEDNLHYQTNQIINNYNLIQKIEAKALEEKLLKEKAEQLAAAKQDFFSNLSHEIRTPLNAIISIANFLNEKTDAESEETQLKGSLKYSANKLLLLVNNFLDFSKLDKGKMELEQSNVNIRLLLRNIQNSFSILAKEKQLDLNLFIDEQVEIGYELDAIKLSQILENLLSNAIKFTGKGHITLALEKLADQPAGSLLRFSITDSGSGIPEEYIDKIFDKFTQVKKAGKVNATGTGLGLAIVKDLVSLFGSKIQITSKLGVGTVFTFDLLLKPTPLLEAVKSKPIRQLTNLNVLLVEDNKINVLVASKILKNWGIEPDTAASGKKAVAMCKNKKYNIILMDLHMPEMDGYQTTIQIQGRQGLNNKTPVYAFTADLTAEENQQFGNCFNGFLHKPIEINKLYEVFRDLTIGKRIQHEKKIAS
jgi:signal transduction histidine kinase/CheY-like chemotaxis protein